MYRLPTTPTPPATLSAPEVVLVLIVEFAMFPVPTTMSQNTPSNVTVSVGVVSTLSNNLYDPDDA